MTKRIVALGVLVLALGACSRSDCKEELPSEELDELSFEFSCTYPGKTDVEELTTIQFDQAFDLQEVVWNKKNPDRTYQTLSQIKRIESDNKSDVLLQVNAEKNGYSNLYNAQYKLEGEAMLCTQAAKYTKSGEVRDYTWSYVTRDHRPYLSEVVETSRKSSREIYRLQFDYTDFDQGMLYVTQYLLGEAHFHYELQIQRTPGVSFTDIQLQAIIPLSQHLELLYGGYLGTFDYVILERTGGEVMDDCQATYTFNKQGYPERLIVRPMRKGSKERHYHFKYSNDYLKMKQQQYAKLAD